MTVWKLTKCSVWTVVCGILWATMGQNANAQDILTLQLQQGFGKNKVRYKDFQWEV